MKLMEKRHVVPAHAKWDVSKLNDWGLAVFTCLGAERILIASLIRDLHVYYWNWVAVHDERIG